MQATETRYDAVTAKLIEHEGEKVRITYRHNDAIRAAGVVSTKDYGHCTDVMLDGRGGQQYEHVTRIEVKDGQRYRPVWSA